MLRLEKASNFPRLLRHLRLRFAAALSIVRGAVYRMSLSGLSPLLPIAPGGD